jgi:hypothetical protein
MSDRHQHQANLPLPTLVQHQFDPTSISALGALDDLYLCRRREAALYQHSGPKPF